MFVQEAFDKYAEDYDGGRRRLIPCFDDFYGTALGCIPFPVEQALRVLDLGAGTGLFAAMIAARYPRAILTLVDVSEKMLACARRRFAAQTGKVSFLAADYSRDLAVTPPFDLVISALSIHHLRDPEKEGLFARIFAALKPGGIFVNADQVLGDSPAIERVYRQTWLEQVKEKGASEAELAAALERMQADRMATLAFQLDCLGKAGFEKVNCWYKNYSFAVFSGERPGRQK
ncbi:class I SAM-dependent methyltransferase [Thiovibrio sp. JS02]